MTFISLFLFENSSIRLPHLSGLGSPERALSFNEITTIIGEKFNETMQIGIAFMRQHPFFTFPVVSIGVRRGRAGRSGRRR
jgi:hypothetical protein